MNTKQLPTMVDESRAVVTLAPALVPTNMNDAIRLAEVMATAKLVPIGLQKSPADCLMVVQQAIRWQMDPFAVAQECSVIQGKLMHSGKLVAAVVNTRGNLVQRLRYDYTGVERSPERTVIVSGKLQGEDELRVVKVTLKSAKTSAKVWETQPDQQLMYHGARVWARRHTPELMLGVYSPEEFDDVKADAERDIANGISVHHPSDYSEGTAERLTKEPEAPKYSRAQQAEAAHQANMRAMCHELVICERVDELDATAIEIEKRQEYRNLRQELKNIVTAAYASTLADLQTQVVHDSDDMEPRPATADDFNDDESGGEQVTNNTPQTTSEPPVAPPHQPAAARVPLRKVQP